MPELPDIRLYVKALERQLLGQVLRGTALKSPFLLRTVTPRLSACEGRRVTGFSHLGKRVVWALEGEIYLVFHLMIAGRFHWKSGRALPTRKLDLAAFFFDAGTLVMTEAGTKKRASLHIFDKA